MVSWVNIHNFIRNNFYSYKFEHKSQILIELPSISKKKDVFYQKENLQPEKASLIYSFYFLEYGLKDKHGLCRLCIPCFFFPNGHFDQRLMTLKIEMK